MKDRPRIPTTSDELIALYNECAKAGHIPELLACFIGDKVIGTTVCGLVCDCGISFHLERYR